MASQCPVCSRANPPEAFYCHFDGIALAMNGGRGPLDMGKRPFAMPFCFPDGQACSNFNQLAFTCANRWEEAKGLLVDGTWAKFFGGMGRLDLAEVAKQAVGLTDRDRGLSQLLERFPADAECLQPAKVAVESTQLNLGQLRREVMFPFLLGL